MQEGRPSVTASFVSYARAAASCHPMTTPALHDDLAARLVPRIFRPLVPHGVLGQTLARGAFFGLVDHIALRTAAIDAVLADGFDQVVLLGAGLDARAYRLPSLARAHVFEVDHPASQAMKRARVVDLSPRCARLDHVAADFSKDDLGSCLKQAGFDAHRRTAWVLEGVTMYLAPSMTFSLLDAVGALSAPDSRLAVTYARPPEGVLENAFWRTFEIAVDVFGEPASATYTTHAFHTHLRDAGLEPLEDDCSVDWAERFGASRTLAHVFRAERLVVAARRP